MDKGLQFTQTPLSELFRSPQKTLFFTCIKQIIICSWNHCPSYRSISRIFPSQGGHKLLNMDGQFLLNQNTVHEYIHCDILVHNTEILSLNFTSFLLASIHATTDITGKYKGCQHKYCSASMRERETFSAVRQIEQLVSIQLRKASDSLKHAIKLNAVPWLISAAKLSKLCRKDSKYSFLEVYTCNKSKDHHQDQRVCGKLMTNSLCSTRKEHQIPKLFLFVCLHLIPCLRC